MSASPSTNSPVGAKFAIKRSVVTRTETLPDGAAAQPLNRVSLTLPFAVPAASLWQALTDPQQLPKWFSPTAGDFRLGGDFKITGNASGKIIQCDPAKSFTLSWIFGADTSWVNLALAATNDDADANADANPAGSVMTLTHISLRDGPGKDHWNKYGPSATGLGWEMALLSLHHHMRTDAEKVDPSDLLAWFGSAAGKDFIGQSAHQWARAHIAGGEAEETATAMADTTARFYSGEA